jgi:cyclopropane-fatty-acyl-phospholipid synthase
MRHSIVLRFIILGIALCAIAYIASKLYNSNPEVTAQKILSSADIAINGERPSDILVHNHDLFSRVLAQGSLGLGESYMDGWWDSDALDQFFFKLFRSDAIAHAPINLNTIFAVMQSKLMNLQSKARAFQVGEQHYDLGDDLFSLMLDKRMIYSCAYWKNAKNLEEAQEHKLDLICKKLYLRPGMKVLDIGCGWGGLAHYMAQKYGVAVTGVTISKEQAKCAQERCKGCNVEIRLQDYRDLNETFDRIVSVGMFEHVGYKNYQTFIDMCHKLLKDDGLMLLHTIGSNQSYSTGDDWINKYIFTNGMLPSICQIAKMLEGKFVMEDWHNFGADYDKTLMAWHENFVKNWPQIQAKYGDRFYRMWNYYLLSCAGLFRARSIQLWQIVISKKGELGGYQSIR